MKKRGTKLQKKHKHNFVENRIFEVRNTAESFRKMYLREIKRLEQNVCYSSKKIHPDLR